MSLIENTSKPDEIDKLFINEFDIIGVKRKNEYIEFYMEDHCHLEEFLYSFVCSMPYILRHYKTKHNGFYIDEIWLEEKEYNIIREYIKEFW